MKKTYIIPQTEVTNVMVSQIIALSTTEKAASFTGDDLDNEVKDDRGGFFDDEW